MHLRHYDQSFGDIVHSVICNSLKVNLNIYNESQDHNYETINVSPCSVTLISIDIHRGSDHYNDIVPCTTQTLLSQRATSNYYTSNIVKPVDPNSVKPDHKASRISYSNDQLLAVRHPGFSIERSLRKNLFHLRIWCPASIIWGDVNIRHSPLLAYDSDEPRRIPVITSIRSQPTMTAHDKACNSNLHYIASDANDPKDQSDNLFYFGYINAQSVREKSDEIKEYINEHDIDSLLITETWLRPTVNMTSLSHLTSHFFFFLFFYLFMYCLTPSLSPIS